MQTGSSQTQSRRGLAHLGVGSCRKTQAGERFGTCCRAALFLGLVGARWLLLYEMLGQSKRPHDALDFGQVGPGHVGASRCADARHSVRLPGDSIVGFLQGSLDSRTGPIMLYRC